MNRSIYIRVDGNSQIGLGHIYRGIALAEMLKDEFDVSFITRPDSIIEPIADVGFEYNFLPDIVYLEEAEWMKNNIDNNAIIVCDGYYFTQEYQQKIKNIGFKLVYIDDLAKGIQKADLVINHSPGVKKSDYKTENYTKLALGLDYALLRKSFINFDRSNVRKNTGIKNILVSFGGADPKNFTYKTVIELIKIVNVERINVIIGAAYKHVNLLSIKDIKLKIYKNLSEKQVFKIMNEADLAIVPTSTISIELTSIGIPMILGYYADNQKKIYDSFVNNRTVSKIGDFNTLNFEILLETIRRLNNTYILNKQSKQLIKLISGNPKQNILRMIKSSLLSIRKATSEDMMFIYNLSNDALVRSNSYNSKEIKLEQHKEWFHNQIYNNSVIFYIVEYEEKKIGQVRFNKEANYSIIGISVINEYRGKGLASIIFFDATIEYFKENHLPIHAHIKKTNIPTIKSIEKAGYSLVNEEIINDTDSFLYIKKKD